MDNAQTDKLEPCPFCGGTSIGDFHHIVSGIPDSWHVECLADDCGNGTCHHETRAEAIAAWNRRLQSLSAHPAGDVALLREAHEHLMQAASITGNLAWQSELNRLTAHIDAYLATPAAPTTDASGATPPVNVGDRWIERWCGSGMLKGSSIWTTDAIGCHKHMVEHFGGDEETHALVRRIVSAHNAALQPDAAAPTDAGALIEELETLFAAANEPAPKPLPPQGSRAAEAMAGQADGQAIKEWHERTDNARRGIAERGVRILAALRASTGTPGDRHG